MDMDSARVLQLFLLDTTILVAIRVASFGPPIVTFQHATGTIAAPARIRKNAVLNTRNPVGADANTEVVSCI